MRVWYIPLLHLVSAGEWAGSSYVFLSMWVDGNSTLLHLDTSCPAIRYCRSQKVTNWDLCVGTVFCI